MIANGYLCTAIDGETICQKAEPFLKKSIRNTQERQVVLDDLLKWCKAAEIGASVIREEFTIIVEQRKQKVF